MYIVHLPVQNRNRVLRTENLFISEYFHAHIRLPVEVTARVIPHLL